MPGGADAEGEDAAALACLASRTADAVLLRLWEGPATDLPAAKRAARRAAGGAELRVRTEGSAATISDRRGGRPALPARVARAGRRRAAARDARGRDPARLPLGRRAPVPRSDVRLGDDRDRGGARRRGAAPPAWAGRFAFEALPGHDAARTARLRARLAALARPIRVPIHASDRNAGALRLAARNAAAAGVADAVVRFSREDAARVVPPPGPGLCAMNPPWGVRLDEAAREAWTALGALLPRLGGWDVAVLGPDRGFERLLPLPPASALPLRAGGLACRLLRYAP